MKTNGCQTAPSSASELHAAYAAGTLTPMQATEHCLRVACASQSVFTRITADRALEEARSEEHTSELQSQSNLVCRLLLEKKKRHTATAESQRLSRISARRPAHISPARQV